MAQKPKKTGGVKVSMGSDWEGTLDSMISGGAADQQAQQGTLGDGLIDTLVSSIPFLITGRDPKLHNTAKTPAPAKISVPKSAPVEDVAIAAVDDPAGKAEKAGKENGNFFKSLLKVVGLGG